MPASDDIGPSQPQASLCPHCGQPIKAAPSEEREGDGHGSNLALAAAILVAIGLFVLWGDGSAVIYGIPAVLFGAVVMLVGKSLRE